MLTARLLNYSATINSESRTILASTSLSSSLSKSRILVKLALKDPIETREQPAPVGSLLVGDGLHLLHIVAVNVHVLLQTFE